MTAAASSFSRDGTVLAGYSVAGDAVAWLMQVSTMKVIAGTQIGLAADVARLAVDLSADGGTLMAAYTSKRAQAGRVLLYRDRTGLAATVSRINSMGMSADRPWD